MNSPENATLPRRIRMDQWVPAERAISDAVQAVEAMPADTRLTRAVVLLGQARSSVADFIDGVAATPSPESAAPTLGGKVDYAGHPIKEEVSYSNVSPESAAEPPQDGDRLIGHMVHDLDTGDVQFVRAVAGPSAAESEPTELVYEYDGAWRCKRCLAMWGAVGAENRTGPCKHVEQKGGTWFYRAAESEQPTEGEWAERQLREVSRKIAELLVRSDLVAEAANTCVMGANAIASLRADLQAAKAENQRLAARAEEAERGAECCHICRKSLGAPFGGCECHIVTEEKYREYQTQSADLEAARKALEQSTATLIHVHEIVARRRMYDNADSALLAKIDAAVAAARVLQAAKPATPIPIDDEFVWTDPSQPDSAENAE